MIKITGKTVVILFCINLFALLFLSRPPLEREYLLSFIALVFIGAVPVLPRGIKQFLKLRPDIYSLSAVSTLPSLLVGFYSLYSSSDATAFFLPVCFLLFSFALLFYLLSKTDNKFLERFNRVCFVLSALLPVISFTAAIVCLFNSSSPFVFAEVFAFILIYGTIAANFVFCIIVTLSLIKNQLKCM